MKNSSKFLASQPSKGLGKIVPGKDGLNIAQGFMEVVRARQQYLQIKEEELTKRTAIQKKAEIDIAEIREKSQLLRDYFIMSFSERRDNFDRCFNMLDAGLLSGNDKQVDAALSLIVDIVKESPLEQAANVMQQLKNRNEGDVIDI